VWDDYERSVPCCAGLPGASCFPTSYFNCISCSTLTTRLTLALFPFMPCACAGLTKLTFLSAGFNRRGDVGKYLPLSLVELQIGSGPHSVDPGSDDEVDHIWDAGSY
jgi:hypothetical protein